MAVPNIGDLIATTIESRSGDLADNVSKNNAGYYKMKESGNIKYFTGGRIILEELDYLENATFSRISGYEKFNVQPSQTFDASQWDVKQYAVTISVSGLEEIYNSGKEQIIELVAARVTNGENTISNNLAVDFYSNGTADGGRQINGLQAIVADTNTNTIGGISGTTWSFWRNVSFSGATDGGAAVSSSNIQSYMRRTFTQVVRGTDRPNVILADGNFWGFYHDSLTAVQRIVDEKMAGAGFTNISYFNIPVVLDGGFGGACPANHMYFLNTKYLKLRPVKKFNMKALSKRESIDQWAYVQPVVWAGNLTCSNRSLQAVLKA